MQPDRASGAQKEFGGNLKETAGNLLGKQDWSHEGRAQKAEGQAEQEAAKAQNRAEANAESLKGKVKQTFGAVTGNDSKECEGRAERAKADVKQ
ncbi:hypothetical protein HK097_008062 [Rhizophlyctis rosea]|uniref:CsbD-like domain-containing protein n=1 Tax=Rhizophlyctis rosea TaxID=64517 RepID=A0AAD5X1A1_9FUNG|nr:hypothetical protein HK097_008062 [Rhizophlyctis rosea]